MQSMVVNDVLALHDKFAPVTDDARRLTNRFVVVILKFGIGVIPTEPASHRNCTIFVCSAIFYVGEKRRVKHDGTHRTSGEWEQPAVGTDDPANLWLDIKFEPRLGDICIELAVTVSHITFKSVRAMEILYPVEDLALTVTNRLN